MSFIQPDQLRLVTNLPHTSVDNREIASIVGAPLKTEHYSCVVDSEYNPDYAKLLKEDVSKTLVTLCSIPPFKLTQDSRYSTYKTSDMHFKAETTWNRPSVFGAPLMPLVFPRATELDLTTQNHEAGIVMTALCGYLQKKYPNLGSVSPTLIVTKDVKPDIYINHPSKIMGGNTVPIFGKGGEISELDVRYFQHEKDSLELSLKSNAPLPDAARIQAQALGSYLPYYLDPEVIIGQQYGRTISELETDWNNAMSQNTPLAAAEQLLQTSR